MGDLEKRTKALSDRDEIIEDPSFEELLKGCWDEFEGNNTEWITSR